MSRFPTETIIAPASTLKDYSGHTVAGASKEIMPADASARLYRIQNLSKTETLWFNDTGAEAAADTPGSYALAPGGYYEFSSTHAVSVYSTTAIAFSAARY
ncbi:hypothetical protein FNH73_24685 [Salmonella enterica subsp. salamae]|nr:hypothetical protein [Salmonella enterica subsp. salamae]